MTDISIQQDTITAVVMPGIVEPDGLLLEQRPVPLPAAGEVLVAVEATGVSFAEQSMRRGRYPGQPRFPFVPGYDLVGTVLATGERVDPAWVGTRVAVATKTGGWATHAVVAAADLVRVPREVGAEEAEAVIVNGVTARQMLTSARVREGGTVLVHGANGGVGTVLVQLARAAGLRVLGTAATRHHEALRALGVEPVDSHAPDLQARLRALAPEGVDAVFDHLGLASMRRSFRLLARGGALVAYGFAADKDGTGSVVALFVGMLGHLAAWNLVPNGRRATFYDFWAGRRFTPRAFRARQHADLEEVLRLVGAGVVTPSIAARFPLSAAAQALALAESRTVRGKVILLP